MTEPAPPLFPDMIGGPSTTVLDGVTLSYAYSNGRTYRLSFTASTVSFDRPEAPDEPRITTQYRARELRDGMILLHWLNRELPAHVTLVIDFERGELHGSSMMPPTRYELFDQAAIIEVQGR